MSLLINTGLIDVFFIYYGSVIFNLGLIIVTNIGYTSLNLKLVSTC